MPNKCRGMHNTSTEQSPSVPLLCNHSSCTLAYDAKKHYFVMQMPGKSFCADMAVVFWRTAVVRFVHPTGCRLLPWTWCHVVRFTILEAACCSEMLVNQLDHTQKTIIFVLICMRTSNPKCWELHGVAQNCLQLCRILVSWKCPFINSSHCSVGQDI